MRLIYFSKNSWWDARKARKVLLPLAFADIEGCSSVLVNAATACWQQPKHPPVWHHPGTDMTVLSPVRWLPLQRLGFVRSINQWMRWRMVRPFIEPQGANVVVLSDPEDVFIARFARKDGVRCWFDWTEQWDAYVCAAGGEAQVKTDVYDIFSNIDGVIVVSRELEQKAKKMGLEVFHLQNAVGEPFIEALDCSRRSSSPSCIKDIPRPVAVYIGSYNPAWIDWECLIEAASKNPEVSFCMIGGGGETGIPPALPNNICLLGRMAYEALPAVLAHGDLCLLLYRPEATSANDPTKLYEYLATGLPIVSTPHPRSVEFRKWITIADTPSSFAEAVSVALENPDADLADARRRLAREHTWLKKAEALRDKLFS